MKRESWLNQMRQKTEILYDHFAPLYWEEWGIYIDETHVRYLLKFLRRLEPGSYLLSGGCGAGKYEGILLEAGHNVLGIDLSEGMLVRARERYPQVQYQKMALHEMDFQDVFDGAICIDALEHVFPEDWPVILRSFHRALKPDGILYFTLEVSAEGELAEAYEQASARGLPVVYGEFVADVDDAYQEIMALEEGEIPGELADRAVYHYYPGLETVQEWLQEAGFIIEAEEMGNQWYWHFLVRRNQSQFT